MSSRFGLGPALLRLYPREFRERFGTEWCATFADALAMRRTRRERLSFIVLALLDAGRTAGAEWRDALRTARPTRVMFNNLPSSFRHAARSLRRAPAFAIAAALTLAIGIGATTAVFSVMSTALLTPLPYPNASRLLAVMGASKGEEISLSYLDLRDLQSRVRQVEALAGFSGRSFALTGFGDPLRVTGEQITSNLFSVLGVKPMLGHDFAPEDELANAPRVIAIGYTLWREQFGGDSSIIGRAITLDGNPFTVTAVMPDGFRFPDGLVYAAASAWTPMSDLGADREQRGNHIGIVGVGRLREGVAYAQGARELTSIGAQLVAENPMTNRDGGVIVHDAIEAIVGSLSDSLTLLLGAALLVLLIGCANVAGLFLTRADAQRREMAIRSALGAVGMRASSGLIAEAILIAVAGGTVGAVLAATLVRAFSSSLANLPRLATIHVDGRALAFSAVVSLGVALACAALPAWWSRRIDVQRWLQTRGSAGTVATRFRHTLVVGQIAMSLMLIVSSALLLRTFERASADQGGIRADNVTTFAVQLPDSRYSGDATRAQFVGALTGRLAAISGVAHAGAVSLLPFSGSGAQSGIRPMERMQEEHRTDVAAVSADYFNSIGMELVAGRAFTTGDIATTVPVAVVDERFAAMVWPGERAVGKHISGWGRMDWAVVGVVRHVKNYGVTAQSREEMFVPFAQRPSYRVYFTVRSTTAPGPIIAAARSEVKALDGSLPIFAARSMRSVVDATVASPRLAAFLSLGYALTALIVAIVGIHGAIAYLVNRRTREIGVRMALGARSQQVLGLVVGETLRLTTIGVVLGIGGALVMSRFIKTMLFGVAPTDVLTYGLSACAMVIVGLVASSVPAWRAARVSPLVALSDE